MQEVYSRQQARQVQRPEVPDEPEVFEDLQGPVWLQWEAGTGHPEPQKQCHQVEADNVGGHMQRPLKPHTGVSEECSAHLPEGKTEQQRSREAQLLGHM